MAYRYPAPTAWTQDEVLKLAVRAVEAERQGYDGVRVRIEGGMVVIPPRIIHHHEQGEKNRGLILQVLQAGPLTALEIRRRSKLTYNTVAYQLKRCQSLRLVKKVGREYKLIDEGGDGGADGP